MVAKISMHYCGKGSFLRKIFYTKIYHMKVSLHKNFQIYSILGGTLNKANKTTLLVSRPPIFYISMRRVVIIHDSILWHFQGVVSWNRQNN